MPRDTVPAFFLYGEPLQPPDERLVHIETIAARSRLHDWTIRPHRHRDLQQLVMVERGDVEVRLDDARVRLRAPSLVIVPAGTVHGFDFEPGTHGLVLSFAPALASDRDVASRRIPAALERPAACRIDRASARATDLAPLGEMLLRELGRSAPGRHMALRGLLAALLANVVRLLPDDDAAEPGAAPRDRELVARYRRLVEAGYRLHRPVGAYAADLRVSAATLRRACLAVTGQPPAELTHLRLLVEAERQLRYTMMPVAQIAYDLGFDDPAYFTRFFTRRMGLSPREFRARDGYEASDP